MPIERDWLAALMVGGTKPLIAADSDDGVTAAQVEALLACADEEGVIALVHQRLSEDPEAFPALRDRFAAATREYVMEYMVREAECRKVLAALRDAQIPVLLMKGSALAWWLYPASFLRQCVDIDLLFASREQAHAAAALLAVHGYVQKYQPSAATYELLCRRDIGHLNVDLDMHWRLVNAPMFAELFSFEELHGASIPLPRLAANARGLGSVHAFLHGCIHRAANMPQGVGDRLKWLYDLHLLGHQFTGSDWSALQEQCRERGLGKLCVAGIEAAETAFGSIAPATVLQAIKEASARESLDVGRLSEWRYMQGQNLAALPSMRRRARWLWQRLFPPLGYLQELYGSDRGLASLWMQRVQRAIDRLRS